jgi:hypothetical protein
VWFTHAVGVPVRTAKPCWLHCVLLTNSWQPLQLSAAQCTFMAVGRALLFLHQSLLGCRNVEVDL